MDNCDLMGSAGFAIQLMLALLSFFVLIYKRIKEKPKRQWKVWWLDTSKQGLSQIIGHIINVGLAISFTAKDQDECVQYLATLILDTTMGVGFSYILLKLLEIVLVRNNRVVYSHLIKNFCSGNYFLIIMPEDQVKQNEIQNKDKVPTNTHLLKPIIKIDLSSWVIQLALWVGVVCVVIYNKNQSKSILYLFQLVVHSALSNFSAIILSPFDHLATLKLMIVMMIIPVILNGFQFWIQDNFLKKTQFTVQEKKYVMSEMYVDEKQFNFAQLENYINNPTEQRGSSHHLELPDIQQMARKNNGYQKAELGD